MTFDTLTLVMVLLVLGLVGAAAVELLLLSDKIEAIECPPGRVALNVSEGRCFQHQGPA